VSQDRFTWIKGDPSFEALRQACIEPDDRGAIGSAAPTGPPPHRVIDSIETENSRWNQNPRLVLNAGLVAIVGARGSGKTALADVLAFAGQSDEPVDNERSFLRRAHRHIIGETYRLNWQEGDSTSRSYGDHYQSSHGAERVQYLSQQFVERLCSSEGVTDDLLEEIERVVFDSVGIESRQGCSSFRELLDLKTARGRELRIRCEDEIVLIGRKVNEERSKQAAVASLRSQRDTVRLTLQQDRSARASLIAEGKQGDRERLQVVAAAFEERQRKLEVAERDRRTVVMLQGYVTDFRDRQAPSELANLRHDNDRAGFAEPEWSRFLKVFSGDVDELLARRLAEKDAAIRTLKGVDVAEKDSPDQPYFPFDSDLETVPFAALRLESDRLRKLIGLDAVKTDRLKQLNSKITQSETQLARVNEQIADGERAQIRITELNERRKAEYARIFSAIEDEARELESLYEPLRELLEQEEGALGRLEFSVRRVVDIEEWAQRGERLLDLRTMGPFRGHGALLRAARDELLDAWTTGTSEEVADAMASFRSNYDHALLEHAPVPKAKRAEYWAWGGRIAEWLTSTGHISVQYGIRYGGVDVEELSPGTRGIVLLLLYLSLDRQDDRPLVIDQPEENLDPKSIFDELVPRFKSTRQRRQIIMVTHNANLVVNTDADQIIVASASPHGAGELPELSYSSGGLEDAAIREEVCAVLEGGESAFKERAARLRVQLDEQSSNPRND
jgi:energy-coupling factor transporter ATP-binding protein EcfA2